MKDCCPTLEAQGVLQERQKRVLWVVLVINLVMFFVEGVSGWIADSNALMADALDMLGDAAIYGFSLFVILSRPDWNPKVSLVKGVVMSLFALWVLGEAVYRALFPVLPGSVVMGAVGALALAANVVCAVLLLRHRNDDLNMRSTWLCTRNDVLANVGVLAAAAGVAWTKANWPDLLVGVIISGLIFKSSVEIIKEAWMEIKGGDPLSLA